jgi:hypothetical protein
VQWRWILHLILYNMSVVKIEDEPVYERELSSKALVATDKKALAAHRKKLKDSGRISTLETELNKVKSELDDIRGQILLLTQYGQHNNQNK